MSEKIKVIDTGSEFVIISEKRGVIIKNIILSIVLIAAGIPFLAVGCIHKEGLMAFFFGLFFLILGIYIICYLPIMSRKMQKYGGAVLLKADRKEIVLSSDSNLDPVTYQWDDIAEIFIADKFTYNYIDSDGKGTTTGQNLIILFFQQNGSQKKFNFIKRSMAGLSTSPKGSDCLAVPYPYKDMKKKVKNALQKFSGTGTVIRSCSEVFFSDKDKIENVTYELI